MEDLPHEPLSLVLRRQPLLERMTRLRRVCRTFDAVIRSQLRQRCCVDLDADAFSSWDPENPLPDFRSAATWSERRRQPRLPLIKRPHRWWFQGDERRRMFLAFLVKHCTHVASLRVGREWRVLSSPLITASLATLESFECDSFVLDDSSCRLLLPTDSRANPVLKHLSIERVEPLAEPLFSLFPALVSLTVLAGISQLKETIRSLLPGFENLALLDDRQSADYLALVSASPAQRSLRCLCFGRISMDARINESRVLSLPRLEELTIRSLDPTDLPVLLRRLASSTLLRRLTLRGELEIECNSDWIKLLSSCPALVELDVSVHEISEEVFAAIGERLTQLRILRMKLTGKRIAATDAAFRSLTRLEKLEEVDLFFDQREENVSPEVMEAFVTGPSQASFRVIRVDHANEENYDYKFAEVGGFLMDMAHEHALQDGSIFGEATD